MQQSRWWNQHDKRPADTSHPPQQQASQQHALQHQQQYAAQPPAPQPAPGFGKTINQAPQDLPKVWEYEDPLKDVHGPFDAAQIINWFAQDWFGLDLKLRRRGNYWTTLEFVLDVSWVPRRRTTPTAPDHRGAMHVMLHLLLLLQELKAEARGTAAPAHGGYVSAPPQQVAPAAATTTNSAAGAGGAGSSAAIVSSSSGSFGPRAGWQTGTAPDAWADAADGWASNRAPAAGAGSSSSSSRRNAAGTPDRGVVLGADGKWERGIVIGGAERGARRAGGGRTAAGASHCDYKSCGGDYGDRARGGGGGSGSSAGQERRERGGRGRRGAAAGAGSSGDGGYERASRILAGDDDDEYGARGPRSRAPQDARPAAGHKAASASSRPRGRAHADAAPSAPAASADSWPAAAEERASPAAAAQAAAAQDEAAPGAAQEAGDASAAAGEGCGRGGASPPSAGPPESVQPAVRGVESASPAIPSPVAEQPGDAPLSGVKALIAQREQAAKLHITPGSTPPRFTTPPRSPPVTAGGAAAAAVTPAERRAAQGSGEEAPAAQPGCEDGESLVRSITAAMFRRLRVELERS